MSRDDGILMLKIKLNKKVIWTVIHVQCIENFVNQNWLKWYMTRVQKNFCFTNDRRIAIKLARKIAKKMDVEYGIHEVITKWHLISDEASFTIHSGKILFHHQNCSFEEFQELAKDSISLPFLKIW